MENFVKNYTKGTEYIKKQRSANAIDKAVEEVLQQRLKIIKSQIGNQRFFSIINKIKQITNWQDEEDEVELLYANDQPQQDQRLFSVQVNTSSLKNIHG